jgi:hypothetical protein
MRGQPTEAHHAAQRRTSVRNARSEDGAVAAADAPQPRCREQVKMEQPRELGREVRVEGRLGASAGTGRGGAPDDVG